MRRRKRGKKGLHLPPSDLPLSYYDTELPPRIFPPELRARSSGEKYASPKAGEKGAVEVLARCQKLYGARSFRAPRRLPPLDLPLSYYDTELPPRIFPLELRARSSGEKSASPNAGKGAVEVRARCRKL